MTEHFDVAILGMGPGGETAAGRLLKAGRTVAVIERELIGGECAYWACVPSKTVLRPPEAATEVQRAAGVSGAELDWPATSAYRDYMIRNLDDSAQIDGYRRRGATVIKGSGQIVQPGLVRAGDREITADQIIIATGSDPIIPTLEGSDHIEVWTNRETYTAKELPGRVVVVGGSAVGIETSTFLRRFGVHVTLVHRGTRLLEREEPRAGELAQTSLEEAGVTIKLGVSAKRAKRTAKGSVLVLEDGTEIPTDVVMMATGRVARTAGLGFEDVGVGFDLHGNVIIDDQCRAAKNVWAIGDVTGVMPFTHVAMYQGRIAADAILGDSRRASYGGIPRVVFADPEIAATGLTQNQADAQGLNTVATELDLAKTITRPWTFEEKPRGHLGLLADVDRKILIGAWAVSPLAGEWIHQASLAIREQIPIDRLLDQVAQYPTYSESYLVALEHLKL